MICSLSICFFIPMSLGVSALLSSCRCVILHTSVTGLWSLGICIIVFLPVHATCTIHFIESENCCAVTALRPSQTSLS